jgi:uncharacterized protein YecE (DUF72 family)
MAELRIGTAGWSVPAAVADRFPSEGTALERYAARFRGAEINSSFHRAHRPGTWERWAAAVPDGFLFSAKLLKEITHVRRLAACSGELERAIAEMRLLGPKLAVVLVQLPPSLAFDSEVAAAFLTELRRLWGGDVALEPRHASWFEADADDLLVAHRVARVAADPERVPGAAQPGGWGELAYFRLHGSPVPYRSSYDDGRLEGYADAIARCGAKRVWCIFDNTASSAAGSDALKLLELLAAS